MKTFDLGARRTLVVAGHGMVGHKLLETLLERGATAEWDLVTFAEENRPAYDRVSLSSLFDGATPDDLSLVGPGFFAQPGVVLHLDDAISGIDRDEMQVVSRKGVRVAYDMLVLATGSYPFVPPIPGSEVDGCFVYRTIDDLDAIRDYAATARVGAVIGGGLLGLEAANALRCLGLETHVVEFAPRLMPLQIDDGGGAALRRRVEALGVAVHSSMQTTEI
ncbi:MAG: FAD-dependent oxidoreductase, partial [Acidimicrobiia bacterium]